MKIDWFQLIMTSIITILIILGFLVAISFADELPTDGVEYQVELSNNKIVVEYQEGVKKTVVRDVAANLEGYINTVIELIDVKPINFNVRVRIVKNIKELKKITKILYGEEMPHTASFYAKNNKIVYVSAKDYNKCVMCHELTHAIVCQTFKPEPSYRAQEILAGYVEYKISKVIIDSVK